MKEYIKSELDKVSKKCDYPHKIKITSEDDQTKFINIDFETFLKIKKILLTQTK